MKALPLVVICALVAVPLAAETPGAAARRFLALAYDGRFDELPKAPDARMQKFERQVRNSLRVRCIRADQVALSVADADAQHATLFAEVGVSKRDPQSDSPAWSALEIVPLRIELVRDGERWLVSEIQNRDEEWSDRLLARSGEEREQLFREHPDLQSKGLARAVYGRALDFMNTGKFAQASDAAELARRIATGIGDRGSEALALGAAANAAVYNPLPNEPYAHMRLAAESFALAESAGDPDVLARAWYDRGRNNPWSRWRGPAPGPTPQECYHTALRLAERAEDPSLLIRPLYSLANLAANAESDYLAARRYIDLGVELAREVDDENALCVLESVLATVYFNQGDRERGLFHHEHAMELAGKIHAFAYPTMVLRSAVALVDDRQFEKAERVFARILTRNEKGFASMVGVVTASALAVTVRVMATMEAERGNLAEAECMIRESVVMHGARPDAYLFELAPYHSARGQHATALALSLSSLAGTGLYASQEVAAAVAASRAWRGLGNVGRALDMALEAIEIRETLDTRIAGGERQRAFASGATSECYELAAELALDRGEELRALAFLERGRARVLTDILDNGRPGAAEEADAALRQRQAELDRDVARVSAALDQARAAGKNRDAATLAAKLGRARDLSASFADGLQARDERRRATRRLVDPDGIAALAKRLPARTVALEYFVAGHELHVFAITRNRVVARTKHVERKELERSVRDLAGKLAGDDLRAESAAREVYRLLLEPVERDIAGAGALLIVPDDLLWRVPFAALVDGHGRFLVQRMATVYAPSLTVFAAMIDSDQRRTAEPPSLLAVGNPTFDPSSAHLTASFYRDTTLGPLPDAEREVDAVRGFYDARHSVVLKRDRATEARTKAALADATIAHFATHAVLDDGNPMYSRLMLARGAESAEDGWLESWEVARLSLKADLVVLSACETGRGRVGGGEGVIGLSWAFFLAGAHSIVATEWRVASDSTAELMIDFHRALRGAVTSPSLHKAQALREAQLRLLSNAKTRHPFHWAPFVLLGDPAVR